MYYHKNHFIKDNNLHQYDNTFDSENSDIESQYDNDEQINRQPPIKYREIVHAVTINSFDRDWLNTSDTPFNFRVKFSPESETRVSYALYENNPTIPATIIQSNEGSRGSANTAGWYDNSNTFRLAYDASQPLGNEVDQEYITIKEPQYAPVATNYKNVVGIKLVNAIIPNHKKSIEYTSQYEYLSNFQYINVNINEFQNNQEGTNTGLRKSFAVLYPRVQDSTNTPSFLEYTNINNWEARINVSSFPLLTIQCYDPMNKLLSNVNDVLDIEFIYYTQSDIADTQTEFLVIKTSNYFHSNEYVAGNHIHIKNYVYRDASTVYGNAFNEFINREEGHIITSTAKESDKYLYNSIYISKPAVFNTSSGGIDNLAWYTLLKLSGFTDDPDTILTNEPGKILNLNMQNTFFFHITTTEPDSRIIPTETI